MASAVAAGGGREPVRVAFVLLLAHNDENADVAVFLCGLSEICGFKVSEMCGLGECRLK